MTETPTNPFVGTLRGTQVIIGALIAGVITFGGIAVLLVKTMPIPPIGNGVGEVVAGIMAVASVVGAIVPSIIANASHSSQSKRRRTDESHPQPVLNEEFNPAHLEEYRNKKIIRAAGLEGGCFCNVVAYIVAQQWWSLALAGGLLVVLMAQFPTATQLKQFLESKAAFELTA